VGWLGGGTIRATGNSFAAPHIAGVIARILGKHPELTPFQMKTVLMT
jgi:subtilisin